MPDPRVQGPQALPGIGPITAMTLAAAIGDIARFLTARKLCAWDSTSRQREGPNGGLSRSSMGWSK